MAKKNRSTLKGYFKKGALPSSDQFADLIDSSLNTIDEGFDRSAEYGFEVSLVGDHDKLISFFRNAAEQQPPVWSVSYDKTHDTLRIVKPAQADEPPPVLALCYVDDNAVEPHQGRVGINTNNPNWSLEVDGVVASKGRIGVNPNDQTSVPADGQWHNITGLLQGCHGFEVMAGAGNKGTGKYAVMQAIALNAFNPTGFFFNLFNLKKRIRYTQSYYLSRGNCIKLRWLKEDDGYYLQMRSNASYGEGIRIQYYITQLWFDQDMSGSWGGAEGEGQGE